MRHTTRNQQGGAIIITVALLLLFLLGFMGIALDFGHLFVVKTELQTAMDSCALAAAQELDGAADALTRATRAGKTAGNLNKVNFQGSAAGVVDEEVTFSDTLIGTYSHTFAPVASARYAKCTHTKSGMAPWLLQALTAFTGNAAYSASQGVAALGVASRTPAQSSCAIPVAINPKAGGTPPNYGYVPGEWIPSLYDETPGGPASSDTTPGHFGWANLDGSSSASHTKAQLIGTGGCNLHLTDTVTPGAKVGASEAWNSRFGIYKNGAGNPTIDTAPPDLTGYSYTPVNWPTKAGAASDFLSKRATNRSFGNTVDTISAGNTITGLSISNSYKDNGMGTFAAGPRSLATHGADRRLVLAPFVAGSKIVAFGCVLMLHPIDGPHVTVYLEYVGNAAALGSPCASLGLAGGAGGPLVPVLVQ